MTQYEMKNGLIDKMAHMLKIGSCRQAAAYMPGGIIALEGGASGTMGLMPSEIRRTRPSDTRGGYARARVCRGW